MSEKQFDHIENRIREAAENSEPDFDEYAWTLMEARLDAARKRKRRPLLWVMAFVIPFIIGGSSYFFGNNHRDEINTSQQDEPHIAVVKSLQKKDIPEAGSQPLEAPISGAGQKTNLSTNVSSGLGRKAKEIISYQDVSTTDLNSSSEKKGYKTKGKLSSNTIAAEFSETDELAVAIDTTESIAVKPGINKIPDNNVSDIAQKPLVKKDTALPGIATMRPDSSKKIKGSKTSRFYLLAAVGIDAGSVKLLNFENSQASAKYGVGIGYQLSKRISVQSGFYASQKKYIAGPQDYKSKPGDYWSMVQIVKVDASCLVYDIPLTFRYNFLEKPTTSYYATAGISSYIMKKEDYKYHYMRYNMPREAAKTYTGNKDLFSVFNLSAGVEKKLSPNFYIQAEPSVGIPLSGVGEGSVKLYAAALQIAIKYQPVKRR